MGEASSAKWTGFSLCLEGKIWRRESCALHKECKGAVDLTNIDSLSNGVFSQVIYEDKERFGEVHFFYHISVGENQWRPVALISLYSTPDPVLLEMSSDTLLVCRYCGDDTLVLVEAQAIKSVVAMVPFMEKPEGGRPRYNNGRFFVVEKPGLSLAELGTEVLQDQ